MICPTQTFNRTILELKQVQIESRVFGKCLLIEPFWNWNAQCATISDVTEKLLIEPFWNWNENGRHWHVQNAMLLIEPFWNWNGVGAYQPANHRDLLIEPFWNWNKVYCYWYKNIFPLLIEPFWNWNDKIRTHKEKGRIQRNYHADREIWQWRWTVEEI